MFVPLDPPECDLLLSQPDVSPGKSPTNQRRPAARSASKAARPAKRPASGRSAAPAGATANAGPKKGSGKPHKAPERAAKPPPKAAAKGRARQAGTPAARTPVRTAAVPPPAAPVAPAAPKKPSFYEAIAIYESGVRGLQRHDYAAAAESFRQVLQNYPEERELIERARLYLRVCERETAQRPAGPQTTTERVYAATMSLSAGDSDAALGHVQRALDQEPGSHQAHYMMAVIRSTRSELVKATEHLRRAIELNPESRAVARQDADLERLRQAPAIKALLEEGVPPADARSRPRARRDGKPPG